MAEDLQKAQQIYDSMSAEQRKQFEQQYWGEQKAQDFLQSQQDRTPTQPQSTTRTQSTPTPKQEIQPQQTQATQYTQNGLERPQSLAQQEYYDDSARRQQEIIMNLNRARFENPQSLASASVFRDYYNYEGRSDYQKQILDNWYWGYTKWQELSTRSISELFSLYQTGSLADNDLLNLQTFNSGKYDQLYWMINRSSDLAIYDSQLNPAQSENVFQPIIDNYVNSLKEFSTTNFYDEYRDLINSPEMKDRNQKIIEQEGNIREIESQITNKRREIEKRYEGTGAIKAKVDKVIADEVYSLELDRANKLTSLNVEINSYNSLLWTAREELSLRLEEYNMNMQQRQMQMKELWFAMELMDFETNAQRDEREWNKFIREQEYKDWNIFSQDPATRRKAISNAVDSVLEEFAWIPMVRSREQMIEDIWNLVEYQWMSLWQAITQDIRNPITKKPEYEMAMAQKFPSPESTADPNTGLYFDWTDNTWKVSESILDAQSRYQAHSFELQAQAQHWASQKSWNYVYSQFDLWDGRILKPWMSVNLGWQDYRITQLWGKSEVAGIDLAFPKPWTKADIWAFENWEVVKVWTDDPSWNNFVEILNDNGYVYRYNHLDKKSHLKVWDTVSIWDSIWIMGMSWDATGVHLDLAVYPKDKATNSAIKPLTQAEQMMVLFWGKRQDLMDVAWHFTPHEALILKEYWKNPANKNIIEQMAAYWLTAQDYNLWTKTNIDPVKVDEIQTAVSWYRGILEAAGTVVRDADDALTILYAMNDKQTVANWLSKWVPWVNAKELQAKLNSVISNIGFDFLMNMKRSTGAGLGNVNQQQMESLQGILGNMKDLGRKPSALIKDIEDAQRIYDNIVKEAQNQLDVKRVLYPQYYDMWLIHDIAINVGSYQANESNRDFYTTKSSNNEIWVWTKVSSEVNYADEWEKYFNSFNNQND